VTTPTTGVVPGPVKVKVVVSIDEGFMASLKMAVTMVLGHVAGDPLRGNTEDTTGAGWHPLAAVVKVHTKLLASALPNMSLAPVETVAV